MLAKWAGCITLLSGMPIIFALRDKYRFLFFLIPPPSDDFSASKKRAIRINCRANLEKRKRTICKIEYDIDFFEISPSPRKLFLSAEIGRKEDNNVGISFENRRRFEIRNRGCAEGGKEAADRVIDVPALAPTLARALTINYRDSIRN